MKKFIIVCLYFFTDFLFSQSILMSINDEIIYTNIFEKNYKKSLELLGTDKAIDNYIDFNLLKQYALKNNIENSIGFQRELAQGANMLKDSLFYPTDILEPILQDYYKKINIEKKFQLLVFKNDFFTNKKDKYKNKFIKSVIDYIGNDPSRFEEAVTKYSLISNFKNPSYLNIFSLNKRLVDAIFKAPLNKVTSYVDDYNYTYLILVSNERKYLGEVSFDQIYIADTSSSGKNEIDKIYNELKLGENFSQIKKKVYQNFNSSKIRNFLDNDQVYNYILSQIKAEPNNWEYSQPIKLEDGYIICEYYFRENYEPYSFARKKIYNRLKKSAEIEQLNDLLISRLKNDSFYKENITNLNNFISSLPTSYNQLFNLNISNDDTLVTIGNSYVLTKNDVLTELKEKLKPENYYLRNSLIYDYIQKWEKENILKFYNAQFFELNPAKENFENLKDQLLIKYALNLIAYQAQNDISGQKKFLHDEANKLTWKERIEGTFYYCLNEEIENKVLHWLENNKTVEFIRDQFKDNHEGLIINEGKMTRESLNLPTSQKLTKGLYIVKSKNRKLVINITNIINNDTMTLDDLQKNYLNEFIDYKTSKIIKTLKEDADIITYSNQVKKLKEIYN